MTLLYGGRRKHFFSCLERVSLTTFRQVRVYNFSTPRASIKHRIDITRFSQAKVTSRQNPARRLFLWHSRIVRDSPNLQLHDHVPCLTAKSGDTRNEQDFWGSFGSWLALAEWKAYDHHGSLSKPVEKQSRKWHSSTQHKTPNCRARR